MNTNDPLKLIHQLTVGFDNLFNEMELRKPNSFPKHNVCKEDEGKYIIEIALAGYKQEEIFVSVVNNLLIVKGEIKDKVEDSKKIYLTKNIAKRNFKFQLQLNKTLKVSNAKMNNGMLNIFLEEDKEVVREVKINID